RGASGLCLEPAAGPLKARSPSVGSEDGSRHGAEPAARRAHAGQTGVGDLAGAAREVAPELLGRLDQKEDAAHPRVAGGEPAAVSVGGNGAADAELAVLHERTTFALLAEPESLEGQQDHAGEGVVDLERVDVLRR